LHSSIFNLQSTPLPHLPSFHRANGLHASIKKSKTLEKPVAFSRPARKRATSENRAQKPFSNTPFFSTKTRFLHASLQWNPQNRPIHIGKEFTAQKKLAGTSRGADGVKTRKPSVIQHFVIRTAAFTIHPFTRSLTAAWERTVPEAPPRRTANQHQNFHPSCFLSPSLPFVISKSAREKPATPSGTTPPRKPRFPRENATPLPSEPQKTPKSPTKRFGTIHRKAKKTEKQALFRRRDKKSFASRRKKSVTASDALSFTITA
jgi:hypothetical protein